MEDIHHGYSNNLLDNFDLEIDEQTTASVKEASKWAKFISIVMFSICGLLLLFLLLATISSNFVDGLNGSMQQYGSWFEANSLVFLISVIAVVVLIIATIYYFLLNFARKVKAAVIAEDSEELNKGLSSLKIYFIIYAAIALLSISTSAFTLLKYFR
jgi:heme/copper-type cytochrome/quinol oxidase subunit 2